MDEFSLGILGLFAPKTAARMEAERAAEEKRMFEWLKKNVTPIVWDDTHTLFEKNMFVSAASWNHTLLFDIPPMTGKPNERLSQLEQSKCIVWCEPERRFLYANHILPKGAPLPLFQGRKRGRVFFDDDVISPVLCEKVPYEQKPKVWMGLTPMEIITQRSGVKKASGRVVIGGLGLGWFLNKVAEKKSVTEIVVVDRERSLIEWLKPVLCEKYPAVAEKVKCWAFEDIYLYMEQDVPVNGERTKYLLDIWEGYGGTDGKFDKWKQRLGRSRIWGWGDVEF